MRDDWGCIYFGNCIQCVSLVVGYVLLYSREMGFGCIFHCGNPIKNLHYISTQNQEKQGNVHVASPVTEQGKGLSNYLYLGG